MRPTLPDAVLLAAVVALAACGFEVEVGVAEGGSAPVSEAPAADGPPSSEVRFGFVTGGEAGGPDAWIEFDEAVWVSSDDEPNGYRIDNPAQVVERLRLAADAELTILRAAGDPATTARVDAPEFAVWVGDRLTDGHRLPFEVVVDGGEVVEARFVYTP